MESRNPSKRMDVIKKTVADNVTSDYNYYGRSNVRSLLDAHILYDGAITGEHYEWSRAGSVVSVDERDVPELLSKRLGSQGCCGTNDSNRVFELIQ